MAELEGGSKIDIVPAPSAGLAEATQGDFGRYSIKVRDFSASGAADEFSVVLPSEGKWADVMLRAAILKRTTWKNFEIPTIIHAVYYADQMGLDIMAGDVYMAEGQRYSTTAGAKIRHAMSTGKIVGYKVEMKEMEPITIEYTLRSQAQKWTGKNLKATVTVKVKDWDEPMMYETTLAEWFVGANPNWRNRPAYMLRRNALSKALEEVAPMGVDESEAPPATAPGYGGVIQEQGDLTSVLKASIAGAQAKRVP